MDDAMDDGRRETQIRIPSTTEEDDFPTVMLGRGTASLLISSHHVLEVPLTAGTTTRPPPQPPQ